MAPDWTSSPDDSQNWTFKQEELASTHFRNAVLLVAKGPHEDVYHALGSGVFVAGGLMLTAKHVYDEAWARRGANKKRTFDTVAPFEIRAYHWPGDRDDLAVWAVTGAWDTPYSDLALLSVIPHNSIATANNPGNVSVMNVFPPRIGETVIGVGFPRTSVKETEEGSGIELGLFPSITTGTVTAIYEEFRDRGMLNFPCFEVGTLAFGGMSGGPIYNESGELCGIVCASMAGYPSFYGLSLWPVLFIALTHDQKNTPLKPPVYFAQLGRDFLPIAHLEEAIGRHYLEPDPHSGEMRLRLIPTEKYLANGRTRGKRC